MSAEIEDRTQYDWFNVGRVHEQQGNLEEAIKAYEAAIEMDPGFAKAWYYKARVHHKLGQTEKAREAARKVLELEPKWEKHVKDLL